MIDDVIVQVPFGLMCDIILGITPLRSSVTPRNCQKAARNYESTTWYFMVKRCLGTKALK